MTEKKSRLAWMDALRALAVIFVVFGHQMPKYGTAFFVYMTPIQMPLFFIISGYFFHTEQKSVAEMLKWILLRLVIPWFVLGLAWLYFGKYLLEGNPGQIAYHLLGMLDGSDNWYMTCYIVASLILFTVCQLIPSSKGRIAVLFGLSALGLLLGYWGIADFAKLNTALTVQMYLALGLLLREHKDKILSVPVWTVVAAVAIYVVLGRLTCMFYPGTNLDVKKNQYYNYAISLGMVFFGNYALVRIFDGLFRKVAVPGFLSAIGRNTLAVYLLHSYAVAAFKMVLRIVGIVLPGDIIPALLYTVFAVATGTIVGEIAQRYCPVLIGSYKPKKNRSV